MMSLWDALRMNMMISYQELVRTFPKKSVQRVKVFYEGATASIFILENKYGILNLLEPEQSGDFCANRGRL
ncbi:hypothetical protein OYB30_24905 [Escherichia coli]|uniref:hypothetical protein n=1 Tax=Escherichia coli TaxID=562 RepID=UPI000973016D|nr:hypothetical protein [Escherichia coli]MCQ6598129.1 hypothetical protein [Escherichia coli]UGF26340.1 hypothetical protein LQT21_09565 [Escherichia coli]SIY81035.1 Uncharacterised protein [Shigella sonnei]